MQSLEDAHTGKVWVEIFCAQLTKLNFVVDVDFFLSASMSAIFFVGHHGGHLVYLHADHHVSHHIGHHNVVSTICEVSETLTDGPTD